MERYQMSATEITALSGAKQFQIVTTDGTKITAFGDTVEIGPQTGNLYVKRSDGSIVAAVRVGRWDYVLDFSVVA